MKEDHVVALLYWWKAKLKESAESTGNQKHSETSLFLDHSNDKGYLAPTHTGKTICIKNKGMKTSAENV